MKEISAPDYCTPLTGWRFWKLRRKSPDGSLWLRSVVRPDLWPPMDRFEAHGGSGWGLKEPNISPGIHSQAGIYAYKTAGDALENLDRTCYRGTFLGKVHLWGVIQKHRFGYRAQFAYPVSLSAGICCICKKIVRLGREPFAIGWASYHFSDDFSVSGLLCAGCNEKYYSLEPGAGSGELAEVAARYGIAIG
ncbi:MAG: hypothetical protein AB1442_08885 [Nitrospirota bacterium]